MKLKKIIAFAVVLFASRGFASCSTHCANAEKMHNLPTGVLKAIAKVESGLHPWAVNVGKRSYYFQSKAEAIRFIRGLRTNKININVGCMQLNLLAHQRSFKNLSEMLEPENNVRYAARLLKRLNNQKGGPLERAISYYPNHRRACRGYLKRVSAAWGKKSSSSKTNIKVGITPGSGMRSRKGNR